MDSQQVAEVKVDPNLTQQKVDTNSQQKQPEAPAPEESEKEINWKKFKEARAQERKQAEEMAKRAEQKEAEAMALKAALEAALNKPQHQQYQQPQYGQEEESEDVRIQKKVDMALAERDKAHQAERAKREQEEYPQRLTQAYSDFNQVCHETNLDYLDYHYPEVSQAFQHMPEGFAKWSAIYKAVKRFVPNVDNRKDQVRAESNLKKPQSISSGTISPQGTAIGSLKLDEQRKAENWARMQRAMKGIG